MPNRAKEYFPEKKGGGGKGIEKKKVKRRDRADGKGKQEAKGKKI